MTEIELLRRLADLCAEMRHAQREYFRTRSPAALDRSKHTEREVDQMMSRIQAGQRMLFE